jgi:hypothetical protein
MQTIEPQVLPKHRQRPRSVIILAALQILQGLGLLGYGISLVVEKGWVLSAAAIAVQYMPFAWFEGISSGVVLICLALFTLLIAIALLRLKSWAWMAAIAIQGLGLLAALIDYIRHRPNFIGMLLGIILVLYLNHREIQEVFRGKRGVA